MNRREQAAGSKNALRASHAEGGMNVPRYHLIFAAHPVERAASAGNKHCHFLVTEEFRRALLARFRGSGCGSRDVFGVRRVIPFHQPGTLWHAPGGSYFFPVIAFDGVIIYSFFVNVKLKTLKKQRHFSWLLCFLLYRRLPVHSRTAHGVRHTRTDAPMSSCAR